VLVLGLCTKRFRPITVERMSERLAKVEEQNRKCEEHNEELRRELSDIKMRLHVE